VYGIRLHGSTCGAVWIYWRPIYKQVFKTSAEELTSFALTGIYGQVYSGKNYRLGGGIFTGYHSEYVNNNELHRYTMQLTVGTFDYLYRNFFASFSVGRGEMSYAELYGDFKISWGDVLAGDHSFEVFNSGVFYSVGLGFNFHVIKRFRQVFEVGYMGFFAPKASWWLHTRFLLVETPSVNVNGLYVKISSNLDVK